MKIKNYINHFLKIFQTYKIIYIYIYNMLEQFLKKYLTTICVASITTLNIIPTFKNIGNNFKNN